MNSTKLYFYFAIIFVLFFKPFYGFGQEESESFIYGDLLPDAPELAARGEFLVGVRTLDLVHENQPDIMNFAKGETPEYDRPLKVEIWYPAAIGSEGNTTYKDFMGVKNSNDRPSIPIYFDGRAERDAQPKNEEGAFPLVIVSHGYLGSRYLMTYLTENLASKGYVVVAIHHTESTHEDPGKFASTLYHRPKDDLFGHSPER